ncbi:MAG TPA: sugar ABC transporter permease [Anaerolineales bacterium]|nr:sugar ABC transporter permease [Anaerolineales bacterium]
MKDSPYLFTLLSTAGTLVFIIVTSLGLGALARLGARLAGRNRRIQEETFAGYMFAAPWIVGFLIFVVGPMLASLYWSFTDFRLGRPLEVVGLENYARLILEDREFRGSLVNTLFLTVFGLPLQIGAALLLAVLLNQKTRGENVFRATFYLPVILGFNAAVLLCWRLMLNAGNGIIDQVIRALAQASPVFSYVNRGLIYIVEVVNGFFLGLTNGNFTLMNKVLAEGLPAANRVPMWIQTPLWSKMSVILLIVWGCGTMMLIFLAGLNAIPRELHEAAEVDGATSWKRFWKITFPLLTPYIFYNLVVGMIAMLQIFEPVYVLYRDNQPLAPSAYSMVYYLYQATFRFNTIGYGSAISWLILIIIAAATFVQFRLQNRWVEYDVR